MRLERPVEWVVSRTEAFRSTDHSRRHDLTARAALDAEGRITGLHVDSLADVGGYMTSGGAGVPTGAFGARPLGEYDIPAAYVEVTGAFTNTTTLSAYRGAGRPEAAYAIEHLASAYARELGEDPVEFRRRNSIDPDDVPYETPFGSTYDSGDYERPLELAIDPADYEALCERQRAAREEDRYLGIGVSTYIEIRGGGSGSLQGSRVRMTPSGKVVIMSSKVENGQGHGMEYARVVADGLGIDYDDVGIAEGDTDRGPEGGGTGGSSAMTMSENALKRSAETLRERARRIAAHELQAAPEDIEFDADEFHVRGVPDRALTIQEAAEAAYSGDLPEDLRGLEETTFFSPDGSTAPFDTHIAVVEVDPETGEVSLERYVAVDDVGTRINPELVEGRIVGGIVQSVGRALLEGAEYDENGNPATGSL